MLEELLVIFGIIILIVVLIPFIVFFVNLVLIYIDFMFGLFDRIFFGDYDKE
ncbi:MAG: hypothetical protein UC703_11410 [Bacilli bacterium]|nr:hypothetical protein [Bacilli bacterium]